MSETVKIEQGVSMRVLKQLWLQHGGEIQPMRRTGEQRFYHPGLKQKSGCYNNRRKDAPAKLVSFVRRLLNGEVVNA